MSEARKVVLRLVPFLAFGPLFMVAFGSDHAFSHASGSAYWFGSVVSIAGALAVAFALAKLASVVARQADEVERLKANVQELLAGRSSSAA